VTEDVRLTPVQRAGAIDRADENIALLSGAGCGKTLVLGRRLTELLMKNPDAEDPFSRFVALTFTEKAALEMSQRVRKLLSDFAAESKGEDRRRLLDWIQQLPEARISTIHSFCASLLRTHAVEGGIDPEFTICSDELIVDQMLTEATDDAILQAVTDKQQDVVEIVASLGYERLAEHIRTLVELRTRWDRSDYEDPEAILERWDKLRQAEREQAWGYLVEDTRFRRRFDAIVKLSCHDPSDRFESYKREQLSIIRELLEDPGSRTPQVLSQLNSKPGNVGSPKAWGGKEALKEVRDRTKSLVSDITELGIFDEHLTEIDADAARWVSVMTGLAGEAESLYAAQKRRRGLLDFTDLLTIAARILRDNPSLRKSLSGQIDQLLLDEGQDTDSFQIALLETLLFPAPGKTPLPPGRLFIVGDDKQSIYRFRGADVDAFRDLYNRLGADQQEKLSTSFRTHSGGVEFINHLFAPLMGKRYEPIQAHRTTAPPHPCVEMILAANPVGPISTSEDATGAQAALAAQRIEEMVSNSEKLVWDQDARRWRAVKYGDIAILFARMTNTIAYERQLQMRDIPYYVLGGTGFFRQQEVYDVLNTLRAIDNPYDDVALFGFLRSGMVGLDDNALMRIAHALDPPYLPKLLGNAGSGDSHNPLMTRIDALSKDHRDALSFAVNLVSRLHRRKDAVTIDVLIDQVLEETGYEAILLSQFQGSRLVGNVRYLSQRGGVASGEGMGLADFIGQVGGHVLRQSRHEQAAVTGEGEDVVRVMTIHKAKGLEFPVVMIPDLNAGKRSNTGDLLISPGWGLTCKSQADRGTDAGDVPPLSYRLSRAREDRDERAEDLRKLYVAATRHKDHLILIAADWRTKSGELRQRESYLVRINEVLGISSALETGAEAIPYGPSGYVASVRRTTPASAPKRQRSRGKAATLLTTASDGAELAEGICELSRNTPSPPLLGSLDSSVGRAEIAITALCDFEHCPMLYRWRYELRTPPLVEATSDPEGPSGHRLDPATVGTLYHRCLELLDFAHPPPPKHSPPGQSAR
jgi:ATP-dependent helicase/nuclease subunit A